MEDGSSGPATAQASARSRWAAIAWAEAFALVGFFLVAYGFVSSIDCLGPECGGGFGGLVGGTAFGWAFEGSLHSIRPALVLGAEGVLAIRPPSRDAQTARLLVVGAAVAGSCALALSGAKGALAGVVLLTLPAVGVAGELVARRRS